MVTYNLPHLELSSELTPSTLSSPYLLLWAMTIVLAIALDIQDVAVTLPLLSEELV